MNIRTIRRYLKRENAKRPPVLVQLPPEEIPPARPGKTGPKEVWRSSGFLLQVYDADGAERLSVNRTAVDDDGHWSANISWEELQSLKSQCGRGDFDAVEIYPRDQDVVNVANMRHLFVFKGFDLPFIWRPKR